MPSLIQIVRAGSRVAASFVPKHSIYSLKIEWIFTLFVTDVTPWVVTLVITSFEVNIEWTGRDSTRWVVNFHSTGVRSEWNSLDGVNYSLDFFLESTWAFWSPDCHHKSARANLRARRALMHFKDVMLITRRTLSLYKIYGDSALMILNGTSLNSVNALLALSPRNMASVECSGHTFRSSSSVRAT